MTPSDAIASAIIQASVSRAKLFENSSIQRVGRHLNTKNFIEKALFRILLRMIRAISLSNFSTQLRITPPLALPHLV
jgi:hypothetical protein